MQFGTIGAGRIGLAVLRRLKPFNVGLHYTQRHRLSADVENELGLTFHADAAALIRAVDIVNLQLPLYPSTEWLFDDAMFARMKRGAYVTPHIAGTSLSAQARYAAGTLEILQDFFGGTPIREEYLIVDGGALAGTGARSYKLN